MNRLGIMGLDAALGAVHGSGSLSDILAFPCSKKKRLLLAWRTSGKCRLQSDHTFISLRLRFRIGVLGIRRRLYRVFNVFINRGQPTSVAVSNIAASVPIVDCAIQGSIKKCSSFILWFVAVFFDQLEHRVLHDTERIGGIPRCNLGHAKGP